MDQIKQVFNNLDKDNKSYLNFTEFKQIMIILNLETPKIDYNNGVYSFEHIVSIIDKVKLQCISISDVKTELQDVVGKELLDKIISLSLYDNNSVDTDKFTNLLKEYLIL